MSHQKNREDFPSRMTQEYYSNPECPGFSSWGGTGFCVPVRS